MFHSITVRLLGWLCCFEAKREPKQCRMVYHYYACRCFAFHLERHRSHCSGCRPDHSEEVVMSLRCLRCGGTGPWPWPRPGVLVEESGRKMAGRKEEEKEREKEREEEEVKDSM